MQRGTLQADRAERLFDALWLMNLVRASLALL